MLTQKQSVAFHEQERERMKQLGLRLMRRYESLTGMKPSVEELVYMVQRHEQMAGRS